MNDEALLVLLDRPMTVMQLRKAMRLQPEQHDDLARSLTTLARERKIHVVKNGWVVRPEDEAPPPSEPKQRPWGPTARSILKALGAGPKTRHELLKSIDAHQSTIDTRLNILSKRGLVRRVAHGKYALPSAADVLAATLPCPTCGRA